MTLFLMEIAELSVNHDFLERCAACVATQNILTDERQWVQRHSLNLAASPSFAAAYASARAGGVERPGAAQEVISDKQILAAVQGLINDGRI